jgi:uncharacterized protein YicC (UPF0701 family)
VPTTLELYEKIKTKLDADAAKTLIEYIQESVEKGSATKDDLLKTGAKLERHISEVEVRLDKRITDVEAKLEKQISEVEVRLDKRITDVEARLDARITKEIHRLESRLYVVAAVLLGFILLSNPEGFQKSLKFLAGLFG